MNSIVLAAIWAITAIVVVWLASEAIKYDDEQQTLRVKIQACK